MIHDAPKYLTLEQNPKMPLTIDDVEYFSLKDLVEMVGISRQTLWRWRKQGRVPLGRRFRQRQLVFTEAELNEVSRIANMLEPVKPPDPTTDQRALREQPSTRRREG